MGNLITSGVIGFQILILVTIGIAGTISRSKLWVVTTCWVIFTLFGSIFTAGLLLLQLVTIYLAYLISNAISAKGPPQSRAPAIEKKGAYNVGPLVIIALCGLGVWLASESGNKKSTASAETNYKNAQPQQDQALNSHATGPLLQQANIETRRHHKHKLGQQSFDLRGCLNLQSNEAIARCSEQAR